MSDLQQQVTTMIDLVATVPSWLPVTAGTDAEHGLRPARHAAAGPTPTPHASPADHETAAALYRAARRTGATVRSLLACLIAAAALRTDSPLLARDRDFEVIARVSPLRLV